MTAHQGNLQELYTTIRKLSEKFGKPERSVKDKGGKPVPGEEGQRKRWMEHFEELLGRPAPQDPSDIPPTNDDIPVDCDQPTKKEIYQAIKQLKNGKSAGPDRCRYQREANIPNLPDDLRRGTSPIRMEGRQPRQAAMEW